LLDWLCHLLELQRHSQRDFRSSRHLLVRESEARLKQNSWVPTGIPPGRFLLGSLDVIIITISDQKDASERGRESNEWQHEDDASCAARRGHNRAHKGKNFFPTQMGILGTRLVLGD
jgi:hypothetical protein